jgi:probable lipoprotein NlpC
MSLLLLGLAFCKSQKKTASRKPASSHYTRKPVSGKPAAPKPGPPVYSKDNISKVLGTARSYIGTPYQYAGTSRSGIDCSGLTFMCYKSIGLTLPRSADDQDEAGRQVSQDRLQPGDLVFFGARKGSNQITHVGIVTAVKSRDEVLFIHASNKGVVENNLLSTYYKSIYIKAVRLLTNF